jgi:hypothetical protein
MLFGVMIILVGPGSFGLAGVMTRGQPESSWNDGHSGVINLPECMEPVALAALAQAG